MNNNVNRCQKSGISSPAQAAGSTQAGKNQNAAPRFNSDSPALSNLWAGASRLSEIWHLPNLFSGHGQFWFDPWSQESQLVKGPPIMMTDPIADMLTRIRNANRIERPIVDMPATKLKQRVAQVLKDEGFIFDFKVGRVEGEEFIPEDDPANPKKTLRVTLKYGPEGEKVIQNLRRVSRPGLRIYRGRRDLKPILDGLGISILSTSRGVVSDRQARAQGVGGEVLCEVW